MKTKESRSGGTWLRSRSFHFQTIRHRLLVSFLLSVLPPLILLAARSVVVDWRNGKANAIHQLESAATLKEAEIEHWLANLEASLGNVLFHSSEDALLQLLTGDSSDEMVVQQLKSNWDSLNHPSDLFEEIYLVDRLGQVVLSTGETAVGVTQRDQAYFQPGLQDYYLHLAPDSSSSSKPSIIVAQPVLDDQAHAIGILVGRAQTTTLTEIITEQVVLGETGQIYLVDSNRVLLMHSEGAEADNQSVESPVFVHSQGVDQVLETRENGSGVYINYRQEPVIGAYRWLPSLRVVLLAEQTQAEAFADLRSSLIQDATIAVTALIITIIVAFYVTRSLTKPIQKLTRTAEIIAGGDYTLMVDVEREDEIGGLAASFNIMTKHLGQLIIDLEQYVGELEESQAALQVSEDRYRHLYNRAPIMMHSLTIDGEFIGVNDQWLHTMGYMHDEVIGHSIEKFMTEASIQYAREQVWPNFLGKES